MTALREARSEKGLMAAPSHRRPTPAERVAPPAQSADRQVARVRLGAAGIEMPKRRYVPHAAIEKGVPPMAKTRAKTEVFAFPAKEKEPIGDAEHVRNAVARFNQVKGVNDRERDAAWRRIRAAARKYGVDIEVRGWRQLMKKRA
jgi:hypothetical protein